MPAASVAVLRGPAVRRLLALRGEQKLTTGHVRLVAEALQMTERTVWRWLAAAERDEAAADEPGTRAQTRDRFAVTPEVRGLLALWKGNVAAVHRELTARAARQSPPADAPPSLPTLHRAIHRDLTPGERAGLAGGERAARKHDVFLARPRGWRNQVWETDHVQAPVLVDVGGLHAGRGSRGSPTALRTRSPASRSRRGIRRGSRCWPRCAPRCCARTPTARSAGCRRRYGWIAARTSCPGVGRR